jgi:uncharacterized protein
VILRRDAYRAVPWANGGGITRDILIDGTPPRVRLSLATIDRDGPFSDLHGYDRTIVLAAGRGFTLAFADGTVATLDRLGARCDFAGESMPGCSLLDGPVQAFNVMTLRDSAHVDVVVVRLDLGDRRTAPDSTFAFAIDGEVATPEGTLGVHDTLFVDGAPVELRAMRRSHVVLVAFSAATVRSDVAELSTRGRPESSRASTSSA